MSSGIRKGPVTRAFIWWGAYWVELVTSCLSKKAGAFSTPLDCCVFAGHRPFSIVAI